MDPTKWKGKGRPFSKSCLGEVVVCHPSERAGLRPTTQTGNGLVLGAIITSINEVEVRSYDELRAELERYQVGSEIRITIFREGEHHNISLELSAINWFSLPQSLLKSNLF